MDKVIICPVCKHEVEGWDCEQCEENEQVESVLDQHNIDNYVDNLFYED